MPKSKIKNDLVKNLTTEISDKKIVVKLSNVTGLGYDGCGNHTHK